MNEVTQSPLIYSRKEIVKVVVVNVVNLLNLQPVALPI